jgi:hypothetical protein
MRILVFLGLFSLFSSVSAGESPTNTIELTIQNGLEVLARTFVENSDGSVVALKPKVKFGEHTYALGKPDFSKKSLYGYCRILEMRYDSHSSRYWGTTVYLHKNGDFNKLDSGWIIESITCK